MVEEAAARLKNWAGSVPKTAVILGTGLGKYADSLEDSRYLPYGEIPGFPISKAPGHAGQFVLGRSGATDVLCMKGRVHFYDGYSMQDLAFPIQVLSLAGVSNLIVTNASGGINPDFCPGDLVLIEDHIKLDLESPLRGDNDPRFGNRFFDMSNAYDKELTALAKEAAKRLSMPVKSGVYAYMGGPQFETPAEIRMLRILGADLVGMSTVPEVITAAHCGIKVLGISCVTNMAAGMEQGGLNPAVIAGAEESGNEKMERYLREVLKVL